MDEDAFLPVRRPRGIVAGDDAVLAGDVDAAEKAADRVGHRLAALFVDVEDRDLHPRGRQRSEEHTSELQSLMRISYAVFCLKQKIKQQRRVRRKILGYR